MRTFKFVTVALLAMFATAGTCAAQQQPQPRERYPDLPGQRQLDQTTGPTNPNPTPPPETVGRGREQVPNTGAMADPLRDQQQRPPEHKTD
jgi:hypothetical protein